MGAALPNKLDGGGENTFPVFNGVGSVPLVGGPSEKGLPNMFPDEGGGVCEGESPVTGVFNNDVVWFKGGFDGVAKLGNVAAAGFGVEGELGPNMLKSGGVLGLLLSKSFESSGEVDLDLGGRTPNGVLGDAGRGLRVVGLASRSSSN